MTHAHSSEESLTEGLGVQSGQLVRENCFVPANKRYNTTQVMRLTFAPSEQLADELSSLY